MLCIFEVIFNWTSLPFDKFKDFYIHIYFPSSYSNFYSIDSCVFIIVWIMSNSSPLHWYHKDSRMVANFLIKLYYGKNNSFKSWNKSLVIKPIHTFYGTCFNSYLRSCPFLWQECLNRETNKYILKVLCLLFQKLWIYKCDIFNRIKAKSIFSLNLNVNTCWKLFCTRNVSSNTNIMVLF